MKDLYTFDTTEAAAIETYRGIQAAYRALFDEIGLPYIFVGIQIPSISPDLLTIQKGRS